MTFKTTMITCACMLALFVACCLVMLSFGQAMNTPAVVYPFIAAWGISALAWPLFAVLAFRARNDR